MTIEEKQLEFMIYCIESTAERLGRYGSDVYNKLKEHRTALGMNQTEMGKLAGVSRQTISLIERGDYSPSVTLALKLARICQVTVEDIFVYEEDEL